MKESLSDPSRAGFDQVARKTPGAMTVVKALESSLPVKIDKQKLEIYDIA